MTNECPRMALKLVKGLTLIHIEEQCKMRQPVSTKPKLLAQCTVKTCPDGNQEDYSSRQILRTFQLNVLKLSSCMSVRLGA